MHVFLEGIIPCHLKYFLNYCISDGLVTLQQINNEIKAFPLGYSQKQDRPVFIKETDLDQKSSTNIGQTASQMHLLAYILPFVLQKYGNMENDAYFECYMSLLEIVTICFSSKISFEVIVYLRGAIARNLKEI